MTRVQKERFFNEEDYVRLKDTYILNREKLNLAQPDMPVLHPLPRVDEIATDVDQDPRAAYFDLGADGKYIRMALIMALLEIPESADRKDGAVMLKIESILKRNCDRSYPGWKRNG